MKRNHLIFISLLCLSTQAIASDDSVASFTGKDAAEAIGRALIKEGAGDEVRVQINGVQEKDALAPSTSAHVRADVDDLHMDKAHSRWDATLLLTADGRSLAPVRLTGRYDEMVRVPTLKQRMQNGDVISEEDIVWEDVPAAHMRKSVAMDSKALIGKSPKRMISPGRPVRLEEVSGPTVVNKGAQVTLIFKTPTLEIRTLGEALENGAQGAVIRVRNVASKSVLQGVVEGEGRVRIGSPDNLSAGLM